MSVARPFSWGMEGNEEGGWRSRLRRRSNDVRAASLGRKFTPIVILVYRVDFVAN